MEILTSKVASMISLVLVVWALLCLVAYMLIQFRKDASFVIEDINVFLIKHGYPFRFISVVLLFVVLPISIPYSIKNIFKK